jgi:hypothetical protein
MPLLRMLRRRAAARCFGALCALGFIALTAGGCYWLRYGEIARTHADLLDRLAADARDAVAMGHPLSNADIERMRYPLDRAEQFARISDGGDPPRASLVALRTEIRHYRELVETLDRVRVSDPSAGDRARVDDLAAKVRAAAAQARGALEDE